MENIMDITILMYIQEVFWQKPFYLILYLLALVSLVLFWKTMERGRRFFLVYSLVCLVFFIYNPIFINICEHYLLKGLRVIIRVFLILPLLYTEAYVLACTVSSVSKKNKSLSVVLSLFFVVLLFVFGNQPYQGAKEGDYYYDTPMILMAENLYKIPQEHIDITESILTDMDGERSTLSMYELRGINDDIGGTLNYSIRMYTSRIQLNEVIGYDDYSEMISSERNEYWDEYLSDIRNNNTDNSSCYFLFPVGDERITDLLDYGCESMSVNSTNYCLLVYTL